MVRIGIVGCGAIGTALAQALVHNHADAAILVALTDRRRIAARTLQQALSLPHPPAIVSLSELIRRSQLVIEAATIPVAARAVRLALAANRDILVMSTGGLLTNPRAWQRAAQRSRGRLLVPSGAVSGLDGLKAMASGGDLRRIRLTTRKPPRAFAGSPHVRARRLRLESVRTPTVLFEGSARQAIKAFPQNINVAATLTLAALTAASRATAAAPVSVRIIADPSLRTNVHDIEVEGECGRIRTTIESRPSRTNPKTSELAIRSAVATLRQYFEPVRIGT